MAASKSYVTKVYRALLQREPDSGGLKYYTGKDEGYVFNHVYGSDEAKRVRAREKRQDDLRKEQAQTITELEKTVQSLSKRPKKAELQEALDKQAELTQKLQELEKALQESQESADDEPKHEPSKGTEIDTALRTIINWLKGLLK